MFDALRSLGVVAAVMVLVSQPAAADTPDLNFKLLFHAAELANQAYSGKSDILGDHPGDDAWVATPGNANVQYILIHNHKRRVQAIAVRGTVDDTNWELDLDSRGVHDTKAGILLHRGFKTAADAIYADVKPRLKRSYKTYLTGHSLGGSVAAIVGLYLWDDRFDVGGILTFGQPKFTNVAGARTYNNLPILRVIYQNDTVPLLPGETKQGGETFAHMGAVLNLLSGPYYVYGDAQQGLQFSQGSFGKLFGQISLPDHRMKWYLRGLEEKIENSVRVNFNERNRHITRHRRGTGGQDGKNKKTKFNFRSLR